MACFPRIFYHFHDLGVEATLKSAGVRTGRQRIDHVEADVMPRPLIAGAGIAQTDNDFHTTTLGQSLRCRRPCGDCRPTISGSAAPVSSRPRLLPARRLRQRHVNDDGVGVR